MGLEDDVAVMVSSDHGETLGELGIYCDHQTADNLVTRLPMIISWPGMPPGLDSGLHYQVDLAATVLELLGAGVPFSWDGHSLGRQFATGQAPARPFLVLTQGAWTAQRSVRFDEWILIHTLHHGYHWFPEVMLFDVVADPHEQHDLASAAPEIVAKAAELLMEWRREAIASSHSGIDPLDTMLDEGGPWHASLCPPWYPSRLAETGRGHWTARSPAT
jgi:arylsulfatase A-like enzyme